MEIRGGVGVAKRVEPPVGLLTLAVEPARAKSGAAGSASFISVGRAPRNNPAGAGFQIRMEPSRGADATARVHFWH